MKTIAIIQARTGSTRLPGKVLKLLAGKTVLSHVIERVKQSKQIDEIVIATTNLDSDEEIVKEAKLNNVGCFRGSEEDVLSRYYNSGLEFSGDIVVRITSDCPLIDPNVIDEIVEFYKENSYDIVSNASADPNQRTYPRGLDTEVFSFKSLENAFKNAREKYQREHVTPYIYEQSSKKYYYKNYKDYSKYRWTLDTVEDLEFIEQVYSYLYKDRHDFYMEEIIKLMEKHNELENINKAVEQKKLNE